MTNNIIRKQAWQWMVIITLLSIFTLPAQAAIPDTVDYQGYLTDSGGSPINGTVFINFSLYNVDISGIALWSDIRSVTVTNGLFNVKLGGSGSPFPAGLFDDPLWLGIDVASDGEMSPRIEISSAAFAFKADDALSLEGQSAASLDQSAHVTDTGNPHNVTAAQTGAVSSATFTLHTGDASAHHTKTTSFTDLTDQAADGQLPAVIARDAEIMPTVLANDGTGSTLDADTIDGINSSALEESAEIDADISTHASNASAHHAKTSSFPELSGQASDAQIPAAIARDAEIMPTVFANDGPGSGLNADLLDGLNSTAFMSAGTDNWVNITGDTMTGNLGVMARVGIGIASPFYNLEVRGGLSNYLGYFYNDNNATGSAYGLYVRGDAYDTGTGWGYGSIVYAYGGSTSGGAYASRNYAYAYGTSPAYGVYSDADGGSTTGREFAFYGLGDSYFSGDVGIGTSAPGSKLAVSGGATVGSAYNASALGNGNLAISGNVGIGTATPGYKLDVRAGLNTYLGYFGNDNNTTGGTANGIAAIADAYGTGTGYGRGAYFYGKGGSTSGTAYGTQIYAYAYGTSTAYGVYSSATGGLTSGREWAFYGFGDGYFSGDVGIGTNAPGFQLHVVDNQASGHVVKFDNTDTGINADGIIIELGPATNPGTINYFVRFTDGDGTHIGGVSGNGAGGVLYSSISDTRLKTNIVDYAGGLDMVSRIKVKKYEFIEAPGNERIGFIAQQLLTVFPQAVSGDPEGDVDKEPMGVDYGRVTPVLVSAIQELIAKNTALEERLAILEARLEE